MVSKIKRPPLTPPPKKYGIFISSQAAGKKITGAIVHLVS